MILVIIFLVIYFRFGSYDRQFDEPRRCDQQLGVL